VRRSILTATQREIGAQLDACRAAWWRLVGNAGLDGQWVTLAPARCRQVRSASYDPRLRETSIEFHDGSRTVVRL
jgi:hypothetical protein